MDVLFIPPADEIYPPGDQTVVEVPVLGSLFEGAARPGHFRGVTTVCAKLFNIVQPDGAFFGQKDYQQLKIIQRMVIDLRLPVERVPVPTVREPDGLAISSRNSYLTASQRKSASVIYRALRAAAAQYAAGETISAALHKTIVNEAGRSRPAFGIMQK